MESKVFFHEIFTIKLITPLAEKIGTCINAIYNDNIKLPVFSKYIIDRTYSLSIPFENMVNNLKNISRMIPYLFSNYFRNTNNLGIKLHLISDGTKYYLTCKDLELFIFDDTTGKITIIEKPKYADKHMIGCISANSNLTEEEKKKYKSEGYILLFTSTSNIETNYNLHDEILKTFPDYPMKSITNEIENSRQKYEPSFIEYDTPFNLWIIVNKEGTFLNIRLNHYFDIDKNIIRNYLLDIFKIINDIFFTSTDNIYQEINDYIKDLEYNGIYDHKLNYDIITVKNKISTKIFDALCYVNDIPCNNGFYLKPRDTEVIQSEKLTEFFRKEIQHISEEITNHFNSIYSHN
ncbi:ORF MSV149 putative RPO35 homolog (vaccinia A29L), similar to SW:P21087 [Melanoplus sanguinipes entomopoxvirus]|uniref:ORF MSV149 putative RPO35 homolog (Vaccinia A29L), similar to SW:P21087 n=1 Tax=Melanoplus sanguinipes entomopoxvirus TaxID=83191 RepID=Q9YVU3_MSEPV|nr:ORF MSV149 putative RPO35 homolog (vaccinia A29L), similar to SW:P21087 [Melanoplus sanguinipes entomopoxvirus]AAC97674.1 ORF MSV149 putative RPO35 homolog (vaccinia A29L), similar to SW:P21087 [Melanoplus sanguinipes entomopoxvirus 'O']